MDSPVVDDPLEEEEEFPGRLLHQAALWDNVELLEDLLRGDQLAYINSQDAWGRTPIHAAAITENSNCLRVLLQSGADPNIACGARGEGRTALHICAEHGCINNVQLLLSYKAALITKDVTGLTAFDIAENKEHTECAQLLKETANAWEQSRHTAHVALRDAVLLGDGQLLKSLITDLAGEAEAIINMAPNGSNTLLFIACEMGNKEIVKLLIENKADGRNHPVTRYSPLYISCYKGWTSVVELLLKKFPELIQQPTVEKWLPIHAACINGHVHIVEMLLNYPYPRHMYSTYRIGDWEYELPFNVNMKDVSGQNILYMAAFLGDAKMVDTLLKYKIKAVRLKSKNEDDGDNVSVKSQEMASPTKRRISDGIQSIMSKLNLGSSNTSNSSDMNERYVSAWNIDDYCNQPSETALHAAVRQKHVEIASMLLANGANPNLIIDPVDSNSNQNMRSASREATSALVIACLDRDITMVELLLKYDARDDDAKALSAAIKHGDDALITKLLVIKAYADPEHKINKKAMNEKIPSNFGAVTNFTYSNMFASTPVMVNWHNAHHCMLPKIKPQWLVDAALHVNPKLKFNPKNQEIALFAITRLDISDNALVVIPPIIFQLQSLRYLNLAQNKIEKLPTRVDFEEDVSPRSKRRSRSSFTREKGYSAPLLEELYLQDNRLEQIPEEVFRLPSLVTLDISNNKLHELPFQLWRSPKLKELNAAFNLLKELPAPPIEDPSMKRRSISSVDSGQSTDSGFEILPNSTTECTSKWKSVHLLNLDHHNDWGNSLVISEQILHVEEKETDSENCSKLSSLNLAHNQFTAIPVVLSCLAVNLTRLNMAYNSLRTMSYITSYPSSLKQLDLSHNKICVWPSLPQIHDDNLDSTEQAFISCYHQETGFKMSVNKLLSGRRKTLRSSILNSVCAHRRHFRLENLRTLVLADNCVTRIQFSTDDDGALTLHDSRDDLDDWGEGSNNSNKGASVSAKSRLMFPNLSMLDLSNNQLREIPSNIHELSNLSVLNISGNRDVTELPPQMGLLSRLWNLNTKGCNLQEPLRSMIDSNKYKTMDVVGFLKSILEDARPYARMKLMIVGVQGIGKTSLLEQLRQEGVGSYKKKPVEHWAKRMGNKNINVKTSKGTNMSTVGVDIGDWVYEKKIRNQSSHGPVTFRTWDFGGQREYYATHQYFLSKRSLYLVVWRIPDGQKGISEIFHWLVNIQARAPNSPVLIVGTHYDKMREHFPVSRSEDLQQLIRDKFVNIVDAEKCGLPRVLDTIEVSCKTRHNIKLLCNLIYDTVFSLKLPGSKELLLEQKVPSSYLALEDVVAHIAAERRHKGTDPVLTAQEYRAAVSNEMQSKHQPTFRDWAELHQATLFLHDNGVLLHYDDATLKDLYFLDPQWLCDMLAHVVTIREINPFARTGIMKLDDLKHVFKSSTINLTDAQSYIVNLLNKFEVALTWDNRTLLIPSLLPSEEETLSARTTSIRIPLRSRTWAVRGKKQSVSLPTNMLIGNASSGTEASVNNTANPVAEITSRCDPEASVRRLLIMTYFPSGFWSRLITRILADDSIVEIVRSFFVIPKEVLKNSQLTKILDVKVEWVLWQTGMELRYADIVIFRIKEVLQSLKTHPISYRDQRLMVKQESTWVDVELKNASLLEIYLPLNNIVIKKPVMQPNETIGYEVIVLDPSVEYSTQLLALAVDHVDVLLEDWYPTLGTRFVHTSEGKFLITRLVPCPRCVTDSIDTEVAMFGQHDETDVCRTQDNWQALCKKMTEQQSVSEFEERARRTRKSQESYASDGDSGVGNESPMSSCKTSVEGYLDTKINMDDDEKKPIGYSWLVEECILASYDRKSVLCPTHGEILLAQIAPDTIFLDLGEKYLIRSQNITKGKLLGRGAFGFVFKGACRVRGTNKIMNVAMKMLQPVQPGTNVSGSALMAYKGAQNKWDRDPLQYACKAYCTARQELNILLNLQHPNIVPLIGVCTKPLALVLDLAPGGALDQTLKNYRRSGAKFDAFTLQAIILQAAKALEYLHQQHIIYRDLKSENVLVWSMPPPFYRNKDELPKVHIKLADYGISRLTLPSGTKGFGGTEGFMAPEIMRFNGEEEYTEKVDCFSFGMFIYELLTLHQPFESHESVKECILEGGRPSFTRKETLYPSYILDLMVICWAQSPSDRPSASQIVSIVSAPEFTHLQDVVSLDHSSPIIASLAVPLNSVSLSTNDYEIANENECSGEVWLGCSNSRADQLLNSDKNWLQYSSLSLPEHPTALALIDENYVWIGDVRGQIHSYSVSDCSHVFSYALATDNDDVGSVCKLVYLSHLNRVAVALTNGRIFLVRSDMLPSTSTMAEGSFVLTELGSSSLLYTLTVLYKNDEKNSNSVCELWCGESEGNISIFTMRENSVVGHDSINHFDKPLPNVEVLQLVSSHSPVLYRSRHTAVWSYIYPGCVVYEWEPKSRKILNKLDCSKLAPCSESIKSISIEEHLSPGRCQVTSICVMENEIYIGTTWGCIVVAERESMRPITVFRPYNEEVSAILSLPVLQNGRPCLATVGRGYRSLIARYKSNPSHKDLSLLNNTFAILWSTGHWAV